MHNGVLELITTEIQILVVDVNYMQLEREACVIKTMELAMRTLKQIAVFTITAESSRAHWLIFIVNISGQTHEIYNLCDIDATSESRKFEKSICHFLANRKRPFFLLANKRARRIMIWSRQIE